MSTELATVDQATMLATLSDSVYPGADPASVAMVLNYCRAARLDPLEKPVHIVAVWDSKLGRMRDVVMPGIGLYRTRAARTGQFAGQTEPEFGPMVEAVIGGVAIQYPEWARVTVHRQLDSGLVASFTAREYWLENYATKGGKDKSIAPNAMWLKRPRGQLGKCASAQALRMAFPELGAGPTAEEMEGKAINADYVDVTKPSVSMPTSKPKAEKAPAPVNKKPAPRRTKPPEDDHEAAGDVDEVNADGEQGVDAANALDEQQQSEDNAPGGIDLPPNMRKTLKASAFRAGLESEEDVLKSWPRVDQSNINDVLKWLRDGMQ